MDTGIKIENMDLTVRPGDDFYDYVTLGWRRANPLRDDYSRYGVFDVLRDTNLERVREIAEKDNGKIGLLYDIAMDEKKLNSEGTAPVKAYLAQVDQIASRDQLPAFLGQMHKNTTAFWGDFVDLDDMNSDEYIYMLSQGGIGLSRDYFFDDDEKSAQIRSKYVKYIDDQLKNFGISGDAQKLYDLEERMAKSFYKKEKLRDPHATYHKKTIQDLKTEFADFDWDSYFSNRGIKIDQLIVRQPEAIAESIQIINDTDLELIKSYLKFRIANSATGVLDNKTYDISFDFYNRTMAGQKEQKPRWKRAVYMLDDTLGEEIGHLYVQQYFHEDAKKRMQELVANLQRAYAMRIENLDWMSAPTKEKALEKLGTFKAKIGYPDKWRDYSSLEIKNDSLYENMRRVNQFEDKFWLDKIGQKVDPTIWHMNAHEVNAYYDPSNNEICFPAGILQYPFFDMNSDDAFNYGAIGAVIGHEMTHGFDDQGRKFDKDGNLKDWWTAEDAKAFDQRAKVMRDFFDQIEVAPGMNANGEFTLGENLADFGGVTIALTAYQNFGTESAADSEFTPIQRFFIAYGNVWGQNIRDEDVIRLTKIDEHSLGRWRINGILPHVGTWYDAFDVKPGDKLYLDPKQRVNIW